MMDALASFRDLITSICTPKVGTPPSKTPIDLYRSHNSRDCVLNTTGNELPRGKCNQCCYFDKGFEKRKGREGKRERERKIRKVNPKKQSLRRR